MTELSQDANTENPGAKFGYLRNKYIPHRESAQTLLQESGVNPKSSGFKNARRKFARKLLETQDEGEVDTLTGLLNEKGFNRRLNQESERIKRSGVNSTLLFIDANNLKLINDNSGHKAGDELLVKIASTLSKAFRTTDILARLHGDEYAAILVGLDLNRLQKQWSERIEKMLHDENLSIAIGAALVNPDNVKESFHEADTAMYRAKAISKLGVEKGEISRVSALVIN
jgi:diguanylate cyclase (GGDEF)-like protein